MSGGEDLLLSVGGLDLEPFWETYGVHLKSETAYPFLAAYKIGELSEPDRVKVEARSAAEAHAISIARGKRISNRRGIELFGWLAAVPLLYTVSNRVNPTRRIPFLSLASLLCCGASCALRAPCWVCPRWV